MGRHLKRVPLDFNYPLNKVWEGYIPPIEKFKSIKSIKEIFKKAPYMKDYKTASEICDKCDESINYCSKNAKHCVWNNKDIKKEWFIEVPKGEGYQLWDVLMEKTPFPLASPYSPVFKTLEELCEWCECNATIFAYLKVTKEEWFEILNDDKCYENEKLEMII